MRRRAVEDPHLRFRQLLSERLDAPLAAEDAQQLYEHLSACGRCRSVEATYREQRDALRSFPARLPPRDLWARTSAALDQEMAGPGMGSLSGRERRGALRPGVVVGATLTLSVVVAGVGSQLRLDGNVPAETATTRVRPTPFGVPPRPIAVVDDGDGQLSVYQTQVSEVCPASEIDCVEVPPARRRLLELAGAVAPRSVAVHPDGDRAVIAARLGETEAVYVVHLPPVDNTPGAVEVTPEPTNRLPSPTATFAVWRPPPTGAPGRPDVTAEPAPTATDAPRATAANEPPRPSASPSAAARTERPGSSAAPSQRPASATPGASDLPSRDPASPVPTPSAVAVSASPRVSPSVGSATSAPSPSAAPTASPDAPSLPSSGTASPGASGAAPTALAGDRRPILAGVISVGASPAWSPDGDALAFSALPADGSRGPDIYIWRIGDEAARPLTTDHRSYFASWSGSRVVASRVAAETEMAAGRGVRTRSVVIDPSTREERAVRTEGLWLPSVDPTGRYAVAWRGDLRPDGRGVAPVDGELYLVDWRSVDPFAPGSPAETESAPPVATPSHAVESPPHPAETPADPAETPAHRVESPTQAVASPSHAAETVGQATEIPGRPDPGATGIASSPGASATASADDSSASPAATPTAASGTDPTPDPSASPSASAGPTAATDDARSVRDAGGTLRLEDDRTEPVLDWQIHWAEDGSAVGFWVADTAGSSWGRLSVVALDASTDLPEPGVRYLRPTLARRAFTVRSDRVVWVAPAEDDPEGELRVRTWGSNGYGGVRIPDIGDEESAPGH